VPRSYAERRCWVSWGWTVGSGRFEACHMLFHGPPGVGKTMLAERVPGLLPDLDVRDALEVSAVHSLAGFNLADELITRPPYSDPHHSASVASIVGGGQRMARPEPFRVPTRVCSFSMTLRNPNPSD
jgi:hypothetical protein